MAGEKKKLNIGVVGYGFMGRTHSNAFGKVSQFFDLKREPVLKAVCGRDEQQVQAFAKNWNYESSETDWRKLVSRKDIDLIDIASPNDTHAEIAVAAAEAGKMVMCEKPLGRNEAEAAKMVAAVEKANVPNMVWYNYRRVPAVTLAKHLIDEGRLGKIYHYRAKFLQDWTISKDLPQGGAALWRLDASVAGSGVTGDLLAHCIDTAMWLNGSHRQGHSGHGDLRQGKTLTTSRARSSRSASTTPVSSLRASPMARSRLSKPLATLAATRPSTRSKSMANTPRSSGTSTIFTVCSISTIAMRESCAAGGRSTSRTAIIRI